MPSHKTIGEKGRIDVPLFRLSPLQAPRLLRQRHEKPSLPEPAAWRERPALTDAELAQYKIKRVSKKTFSVQAAKLDMGKAVKARQQKDQAENRKAA